MAGFKRAGDLQEIDPSVDGSLYIGRKIIDQLLPCHCRKGKISYPLKPETLNGFEWSNLTLITPSPGIFKLFCKWGRQVGQISPPTLSLLMEKLIRRDVTWLVPKKLPKRDSHHLILRYVINHQPPFHFNKFHRLSHWNCAEPQISHIFSVLSHQLVQVYSEQCPGSLYGSINLRGPIYDLGLRFKF